MGGTTSVTLRKPSGEEFRMTRWTNSMPYGICNAKMFDADEAHMDEYLEQWLDMKRDYEANKDTGNFEHNMTDCYFPSAGLAPCGYGLTVVDHVTHTIFDMQGYTSFHNMSVAGVGLDINKVGEGKYECSMDVGSSFLRFKDFLEEGRITGIEVINPEGNGLVTIPLPTKDLKELVNIIGDYDNKTSKTWFNFALDISPFTIKRFEESSIGAASMFACLEEAGFEFSDEERKEWADWIKEKKEWEEEDEEEYEDA